MIPPCTLTPILLSLSGEPAAGRQIHRPAAGASGLVPRGCEGWEEGGSCRVCGALLAHRSQGPGLPCHPGGMVPHTVHHLRQLRVLQHPAPAEVDATVAVTIR